MKKNVKKWLIGILASVTAVFAVVATGCSAQEKLDTWYEQLTCEHTKVEKVVEKAPTCTEDGYSEHDLCKDCGKEIGKKVIKATGHENTTIIEGYAATCTTMGKTDGEYCNDCQKTVVEQKTIYATGHKKKYVGKQEATCTEDGHTSGWICGNEDCDYVYSGYEVIPATGHSVVDGNCEDCGEIFVVKLTDVKVGDNLSGMALRLNVSNTEFIDKYLRYDNAEGMYLPPIGLCNVFDFFGGDLKLQFSGLSISINNLSMSTVVDLGCIYGPSGMVTFEGSIPLDKDYIVDKLTWEEAGTDEESAKAIFEYLSCFEFYRVDNTENVEPLALRNDLTSNMPAYLDDGYWTEHY